MPPGSAQDAAPIAIHLSVHGEPLVPAAGSTAGVWFHADPAQRAQILLTGHPEVPGSWRLTAALGSQVEVRLVFEPPPGHDALPGFRREPGEPTDAHPSCRAETNTLILSSTLPGVVRLTSIAFGDAPARLAPRRRPFSRGPVEPSPDPHPALAEALIEWDWRLQDGIETPREPRTHAQANDRLLRGISALIDERRRLRTLEPAELAAWEALRHGANDASAPETRWLELHRLRRSLVLSNPLFRLSSLVFVKHVPSVMSHQLTQMYGYCARPGGGLFELTEPGRSMRTRDLTPASLPAGNFMTPELTHDGQHLLFAHCPVREAPQTWDHNEQTRHLRYHIHKLTLASGSIRQLTSGDSDNFSPVELPDGDVLLVSTRRGGFHRCGRGPCFVYTLARMGADGADPRSVSFHETHEWDPCLLHDGRVAYTRWDYVDRNAVHYQQLWSTYPDGGAARILYGNNTWNPTGLWEARAIPGSDQIMATAAAHHAMSAGTIVRIDPTRGVDGPAPLVRLTPDVRFPESESPLAHGPDPSKAFDFDTPATQFWRTPLPENWAVTEATEEERRWPGHCYKSPWPLSESFFLVSYSYDGLRGEPGPNLPNQFGLYFADAFGNRELVYRDPAISSLWARPLAPRPRPPTLATPRHDSAADTGTFFVHDVQDSWPALPRGTAITHLRILQVLLKTTPHADTPRVGAAFAAPGKQVLGTVPVEADGSAHFEVPARTPVLFQALDAQGRAVQTMRSLVYLQPGERQTCIGCHEHRDRSPAADRSTLAALRPPSAITPGPEGSRPFSYPRLVQPVLDRHCVRCHDGREPGRSVLTGEPEGGFTKSYNALIPRVSFSAWGRPERNFEPLTEPLRFGTLGSPLAGILEDATHRHIPFTPADRERLHTWMDANALFYGTFDVDEQRRQLAGEAIQGPIE